MDTLADDALDTLLGTGPTPPAAPPVAFEVRGGTPFAVAAVVAAASKADWEAPVRAGADAPVAAMRAAVDAFFAAGVGARFVSLTGRLSQASAQLDQARLDAAARKQEWLAVTASGADPADARRKYRGATDAAADLGAEFEVLLGEYGRLRDEARAGLQDALHAEWGRLAATRPEALAAAENAAAALEAELNKPSVVAAAAGYAARLAELHALGGGCDLARLIRDDGRLDRPAPRPSAPDA